MDEAPGGREQREFTVDARSSPSNDEKGWACALQKLTFRTGPIVQTGETAKRSKKKRPSEAFAQAFLLHVKLSADGSEASEDKGRLPGPSQSFRLSLRITFFEFSVDAACRWEGGAHLVRAATPL